MSNMFTARRWQDLLFRSSADDCIDKLLKEKKGVRWWDNSVNNPSVDLRDGQKSRKRIHRRGRRKVPWLSVTDRLRNTVHLICASWQDFLFSSPVFSVKKAPVHTHRHRTKTRLMNGSSRFPLFCSTIVSSRKLQRLFQFVVWLERPMLTVWSTGRSCS